MATSTALSGVQKAAILLMQLDTAHSAALMRQMRDSEVAEISAEIARLESVEPDDAFAVLEEFRVRLTARSQMAKGGIERAREILEEGLGHSKAEEILEQLGAQAVPKPFEFLRRADPRQIITYLQDEHPQTVALVLAHMSSEAGAMVLGSLPDELQVEVAKRLATMDRTSPEVIETVESVLEPRFSSVVQQADMSHVGGVEALVELLNRSDRATERLILERLERDDEALAEEVRSRLFVFEDVISLDDRAVQTVLREVDAKDLAVALKGVQDAVREKIECNMSERAAQNLAEEIELLGAVRLKQVEEAQGGIVRIIRALEESGQIVVSRSGDEFVE